MLLCYILAGPEGSDSGSSQAALEAVGRSLIVGELFFLFLHVILSGPALKIAAERPVAELSLSVTWRLRIQNSSN